MNESIVNEMKLLYNVYSVKGKERNKIDAICSNVLDNEEYVSRVKKSLDNVFNNDDFNFSSEFTRLILNIININKSVDYYKEISPERMKFILYGVLYYYLLKNQQTFLNQISMGDIRLLYCNSIDLLLLVPETIKVDKESCCNCLGRTFDWFSCLRGDRVKI